MPSVLTLLLHPEQRRQAPDPPRADLRRVMLVGIAAWAVALVVAGALLAFAGGSVEFVATCGAGILLGLLGLVWARRHRDD
ncbi:DUF2530 domain-containing protein [Isoptericola aurantiacus]|uniref:DUF2530 domain-containing protein n=1 Tax=Isoptericola aurantiacus TaxID=3377839 RepID=UPI00383A98C9